MDKTTIQLTKAARDRLQAAKYHYRHRNVSQTINHLIDVSEDRETKPSKRKPKTDNETG